MSTGNGTSSAFQVPNFPDPSAFYEMGVDWDPGAIRYFVSFDGKTEVTLWHSTDWWNSASPDLYPASDATLRVDWLRYWAR